MRPSKDAEVIVVLDTLPECQVVMRAIENRAFMRVHQQENLRERFRSETQHEPVIVPNAEMAGTLDLEWNPEPEFKVRREDVTFIIDAAQFVLSAMSVEEPKATLFDRVINRAWPDPIRPADHMAAAQAIILELGDEQ